MFKNDVGLNVYISFFSSFPPQTMSLPVPSNFHLAFGDDPNSTKLQIELQRRLNYQASCAIKALHVIFAGTDLAVQKWKQALLKKEIVGIISNLIVCSHPQCHMACLFIGIFIIHTRFSSSP